MGPSGPFKLCTMGSFKYTNEAFKLWQKERKQLKFEMNGNVSTKPAQRRAQEQAYKDMESVLCKVNALGDPYFDVWDVSRSRVFSLESLNLNKKLTFL
jgi:hypothetical protein